MSSARQRPFDRASPFNDLSILHNPFVSPASLLSRSKSTSPSICTHKLQQYVQTQYVKEQSN